MDQGQNYISGYINDESKLIKITTPICIFGDHTRIIKWVEHNFVPGADGTKLLKPKDFIYPRYAYYSLCALNIPDKGYSRHFKYFKELKIDIPAWEEQKIIAEKLDTLLAQVESTKARLEQIPQILKRFRQAVLGTAMSGNLTGEWRLSNHSIILAEEIEENKNRLIEKKLVKKDLTYASLDKRYSLPPSWLYIKLQSVSTKITDGEHKTPKRETAGKFLLSARNIQDGYIKLADVDYVGDAEFQKLRNRCDPDYGDILISCSGSIGRVCLVDENSKYVMVRSVALVKLMQDFVINKYMMFLLQSPLLQKEIEENSKSTAQSNLFLGPIKNLGIPLPPVSEQHEIVRRVEQLFAYADTIEKQVNNALARVNNLTQSILAKAFRGELTAQWRAENPELISGENSAAALLEKIKAERAASGGKKASRKKS
ncbi:restriction endonuclease subunit S [Escherichia coli]|nr:restriction endonuclease subunit S [Escherichia coli]ELC8012981.1 restriction endonuclease subunit S [Escherichia coli]MBS8916072.1 restriction endonuclease subunit S [Escherichia coli]HBD3084872.1 restriction endonuclease subunit S [Escherichia coli]HBE5148247.1 restriction endonuclease subunit S [Escherichia coli]